jgi:hypothetical protein
MSKCITDSVEGQPIEVRWDYGPHHPLWCATDPTHNQIGCCSVTSLKYQVDHKPSGMTLSRKKWLTNRSVPSPSTDVTPGSGPQTPNIRGEGISLWLPMVEKEPEPQQGNQAASRSQNASLPNIPRCFCRHHSTLALQKHTHLVISFNHL